MNNKKVLKKELKTPEHNLFSLSGQEEATTPYLWDSMPSYNQINEKSYACFNVRVESQEDLDKVAELLGQPITVKTRAIRYPARDRFRNTLLRWVTEENTEQKQTE